MLAGLGSAWAEKPAAVVLDDFETLSGWAAAAAEGTHVEMAQDTGRTGMGMRIDFDFRGGTGFVTVRKKFSIAEDHDPDSVLDAKPETSWRSGALAESQWLQIDFLEPREYGGLIFSRNGATVRWDGSRIRLTKCVSSKPWSAWGDESSRVSC